MDAQSLAAGLAEYMRDCAITQPSVSDAESVNAAQPSARPDELADILSRQLSIRDLLAGSIVESTPDRIWSPLMAEEQRQMDVDEGAGACAWCTQFINNADSLIFADHGGPDDPLEDTGAPLTSSVQAAAADLQADPVIQFLRALSCSRDTGPRQGTFSASAILHTLGKIYALQRSRLVCSEGPETDAMYESLHSIAARTRNRMRTLQSSSLTIARSSIKPRGRMQKRGIRIKVSRISGQEIADDLKVRVLAPQEPGQPMTAVR